MLSAQPFYLLEWTTDCLVLVTAWWIKRQQSADCIYEYSSVHYVTTKNRLTYAKGSSPAARDHGLSTCPLTDHMQRHLWLVDTVTLFAQHAKITCSHEVDWPQAATYLMLIGRRQCTHASSACPQIVNITNRWSLAVGRWWQLAVVYRQNWRTINENGRLGLTAAQLWPFGGNN